MSILKYRFKYLKLLLLLFFYSMTIFELGKMSILSRMQDSGLAAIRADQADMGTIFFVEIIKLDNTILKIQAKKAAEILYFAYPKIIKNNCVSKEYALDSIDYLNDESRVKLLSHIVNACNRSSDQCNGDVDFWEKALAR